MNINRNNCESFFLDYYEKNLSPVEVAEVLFFLEENPDLKEVFESYETVFLEHEKVNFPDKESLKKKYSHGELDLILASPVSLSNCEQFFVASAEEILTDEQTRRLYAFLAQHPEKKKDFELIQKCKLDATPIVYEHKDLLKKNTVHAGNREKYFIRSLEGDLNVAEQKQLALFLRQNPQYKKELEAFKYTMLVPEKIEFKFKSELKKKERKPIFVALFAQRSTYYAAAAAVLLLAGLFFFFRSSDNEQVYLAGTTENKITAPAKVEANQGSAAKEENANDNDQPLSENDRPFTPSSSGVANTNAAATKNNAAPALQEQQHSAPAPLIIPENKTAEPLMANKEEEKKKDEAVVETPALANNTDAKSDSASVPAPLNTETMAFNASSASADDGYQSLGTVVNKKVRSLLGIKQPTPCESSEKIGLWDLAMAAKNGVQKLMGTKALDVNKVCDGKGEKVEYVFAAGNFEISKSASR